MFTKYSYIFLNKYKYLFTKKIKKGNDIEPIFKITNLVFLKKETNDNYGYIYRTICNNLYLLYETNLFKTTTE